MSSQINFAKALGIESLAGAVVFMVLYVPLLAFFIRKSLTHSTYVHYVLTLFCTSKQTYLPDPFLQELNIVDPPSASGCICHTHGSNKLRNGRRDARIRSEEHTSELQSQ